MQSAGFEGSSSVVGFDRSKDVDNSLKDRANMSDKKVQEISEALVRKINEECRRGCPHCLELVRSLDVADEKR